MCVHRKHCFSKKTSFFHEESSEGLDKDSLCSSNMHSRIREGRFFVVFVVCCCLCSTVVYRLAVEWCYGLAVCFLCLFRFLLLFFCLFFVVFGLLHMLWYASVLSVVTFIFKLGFLFLLKL
jgi:hypothetical protein